MAGRGTEEKMILMVSAISVVALLPFAIMRTIVGDFGVAAVDSIGFLITLALFIYVYRTREVEFAGLCLSLLAIGGMVINIYLKGVGEIYFLYPTMVASYFLAKPAYALGLSVVALVVLLPVTLVQLDGLTFAKIYLSVLGCVLFTYAFASQRNEQRDQLLLSSTKDSLTGAGNRRAMDRRLADALRRFERTASPMSLIILDLDKFKQINDTAGHAVGDELLVRVTSILQSRIRVTDDLFRYGGDEFIVLADTADLATGAQLAEDLRALVEADLSISGWQLSISLGVAAYTQGETREAWLKRADEALLESKRLGRNQVVVSESPLPPANPAPV
jgi:diguanylate cyclase